MDSIRCLNQKSIQLLDKHGLLRKLITAELQENLIKNVSITEEQKQDVFNQYCKSNNLNNQESLNSFLTKNCLTIEKIVDQLSLSLKRTLYARDNYLIRAENRFLER